MCSSTDFLKFGDGEGILKTQTLHETESLIQRKLLRHVQKPISSDGPGQAA